jgi:hypothetical protein
VPSDGLRMENCALAVTVTIASLILLVRLA